MGGPIELDEEAWRRSFDLNVTSCFITCKHVLPHMLAQKSGAIVNVSSVAAIRYTGYPYPAYYAAKAAVNNFTMGLALQYARDGIRVNAIMPGLMNTPLIFQQISGQYATAEEMVAARDAACPTGQDGDRLGRREGRPVPGLGRRRLHHRSQPARRRRPELPRGLSRSRRPAARRTPMPTDRIEADYLLETPIDPARAAEIMAGEQSSGTFVAGPGRDAGAEGALGRARRRALDVLDDAVPRRSLPPRRRARASASRAPG